jgi:hypothetical protein
LGQDHSINPTAQEEGRPEITCGHTDLRAAHFDVVQGALPPQVELEAGTSLIDEVPSIMKNNTGGMGLEEPLAEAQPPPVPEVAPVPVAPVAPVPVPPELAPLPVPPLPVVVRPPEEPGLLVPPVLPGLLVPPVPEEVQSPQAPLTHVHVICALTTQ